MATVVVATVVGATVVVSTVVAIVVKLGAADAAVVGGATVPSPHFSSTRSKNLCFRCLSF